MAFEKVSQPFFLFEEDVFNERAARPEENRDTFSFFGVFAFEVVVQNVGIVINIKIRDNLGIELLPEHLDADFVFQHVKTRKSPHQPPSGRQIKIVVAEFIFFRGVGFGFFICGGIFDVAFFFFAALGSRKVIPVSQVGYAVLVGAGFVDGSVKVDANQMFFGPAQRIVLLFNVYHAPAPEFLNQHMFVGFFVFIAGGRRQFAIAVVEFVQKLQDFSFILFGVAVRVNLLCLLGKFGQVLKVFVAEKDRFGRMDESVHYHFRGRFFLGKNIGGTF